MKLNRLSCYGIKSRDCKKYFYIHPKSHKLFMMHKNTAQNVLYEMDSGEMVTEKEQELRRLLEKKEEEFWSRFWSQWDQLYSRVKTLEDEAVKLRVEMASLTIKISLLVGGLLFALQWVVKHLDFE